MSPLLDLHADREVRAKALLLGHIRLGVFADRHPQQTETFVFTSTDRLRLDPLARDFGGEVKPYKAQGAGTDTWRLISETDAFTALFAFGELEGNFTQDWMLWTRTGLRRRCDGFTVTRIDVDGDGLVNEFTEPCICRENDRRECAPETRLRFLLPQTGLGLWELTTGSKIGAIDLYDQVRFIAAAAGGRMNHLPIRLVYAPREIRYPGEDGRLHTTTKRLLSLSVATDAERALAAINMEPNRALLGAVSKALEDAGRELGAATRPALAAAVAEEQDLGGPDVTSPPEPVVEEPGATPFTPAPGDDLPASTEAWERAGAAGLTGRKALAIAKGLKFDVHSATDITAGQLSTILGKHLDGAR